MPAEHPSAITVHLDELLASRGMTMTELAEQVGVTLANMSILKTGKARAIRFTTLSAICAALNCQPGDLLSFQPADPGSDFDTEESAATSPAGPAESGPAETRGPLRPG